MARAGKIALALLTGAAGLTAVVGASIFGLFFWQGSRPVDTSGEYVALGSSFAAGIGLGPRAPGSPLQCLRTRGGYPSLVAERTGLRLVDMTCSGSTSSHILDGGQLMLGPQLAAIGPSTRLVTLTTGGNDVGYVGDLVAASGAMGGLVSVLHGRIRPPADRPYDDVSGSISRIVARIHEKAPAARIVVVNYPAILPPQGECPALGIDAAQAAVSREVARRLARATEQAARRSDVLYLDMARESVGHDACSAEPWVNGAGSGGGAAFHPNAVGTRATADRILAALKD
ncbi:SGNH/GDSL hydrolase family protein [Rhizobium sp. CRIBSB]|nr:SGNH/GDSL hydrolase family protein [Rhizobium sp. CRIBSB]